MTGQAASREIISRYEAKYLVSEAMARAIRDHVRGICSPDAHAGPDGRYLVNNLYFDTPDLRFYHDTRFKQFTRFKPRARFYGPTPDDWIWLELKHKVKGVTWKVRRRVDSSRLPLLFDDPGWGLERRTSLALSEGFEEVVSRFGASPLLQVQYVREPFVSDLDEYGRVTFDRHLLCRPIAGPDSLVAGPSFVPFDDPATLGLPSDASPVILEIKTDVRVPAWVQGMIRCFGLQRQPFSKYCRALERSWAESVPGDLASALPERSLAAGPWAAARAGRRTGGFATRTMHEWGR